MEDFTTPQEPPDMEGKIYRLLGKATCFDVIKERTGFTYKQIRDRAVKYERAGLIERILHYPALYRFKKEFLPPLKGVRDFTSPALILPVKFGGSFRQMGRPAGPEIKYGPNGKAIIDEPDHKAIFGKNGGKTVIWIKAFWGPEPWTARDNALAYMKNKAAEYAEKYRITLTLNETYPKGYFEGVEHVVTTNKLSEAVAKALNLKKGEVKRFPDLLIKYSDFSHPNKAQLNPVPENPTAATDYSDNFYKMVKDGPDAIDRANSTIEKVSVVLDKLTDALVLVHQRIDIVEDKTKKKEG